jgi:hypothetical protein
MREPPPRPRLGGGRPLFEGYAARPSPTLLRGRKPLQLPLRLKRHQRVEALDAPHIAGHPEMYLIAQLEACRSGARQNEMMTVVAQDLSDDDIANLSAYYSRIEVSAKVPDGS